MFNENHNQRMTSSANDHVVAGNGAMPQVRIEAGAFVRINMPIINFLDTIFTLGPGASISFSGSEVEFYPQGILSYNNDNEQEVTLSGQQIINVSIAGNEFHLG
jgi:hypothetical protein